MTANRTNQPARSPRHLYDTGKFATLPPHLRPYRPTIPGSNAKTAKTHPHLVADGSKGQSWPTQAGSPTKALQPPVAPKPRPFVPSPTVEPPMTKAAASTMHNLCLFGAVAVAAIGVVALIVGVLT